MAPHMCDTVIILYLHTESLSQSSPMHISHSDFSLLLMLFSFNSTLNHMLSQMLAQNTSPYSLAELLGDTSFIQVKPHVLLHYHDN